MLPTSQSDSTVKADRTSPPELVEALNLLWVRFLPEMRNRADILGTAAVALGSAGIPDELREAAHAAAHKLAGTLGTFSLERGSELARELELAFASPVDQNPSLAEHLAAVAAELRTVIDSRT